MRGTMTWCCCWSVMPCRLHQRQMPKRDPVTPGFKRRVHAGLGTGLVRRVVEVAQGRLHETQRVQADTAVDGLRLTSDGFFFGAAEAGSIDGGTGDWELRDSAVTILEQGELQLQITLTRRSLAATKTYVLYPLSSVIREWVTFKNVGQEALLLTDPGFLDLAISTPQPSRTRFFWMSGGASVWGSWRLYNESLTAEKQREFDTYDPFPVPDDIVEHLPGNGTRAKILHNENRFGRERIGRSRFTLKRSRYTTCSLTSRRVIGSSSSPTVEATRLPVRRTTRRSSKTRRENCSCRGRTIPPSKAKTVGAITITKETVCGS